MYLIKSFINSLFMFFLVFKDIMPPKIEFPSLCPRQTRDGIVALSGIHRRKSLIFPNLAVTCIAQYLIQKNGMFLLQSGKTVLLPTDASAIETAVNSLTEPCRIWIVNIDGNHLPDAFLSGCENLVGFDASEMTEVHTIGDFFLNGCINLKSFDTRGMSRVHTIGDNFLNGCTGLVSFDSQWREF